MSKYNSPVEEHYSRTELFEKILQRLKDIGIDKSNVTRKDIAGVDEFHIRGAESSIEIAKGAGLSKDTKILDVGCGIGGPARMLADEFGCMVTGVDITQEFVRTAGLLSELVGLQDLTKFVVADATKLPFENESFDVVWTQHVQMNIENKAGLYSEIARVLKKGGQFIYYDILSAGNGPIFFPVPWADTAELSHLITIDELDKLLLSNGMAKLNTKDQTEEGIKFLEAAFEKTTKEGPPKMGIHILMEASAPEKLKNVYRNLMEKKIVLQSGTYQL